MKILLLNFRKLLFFVLIFYSNAQLQAQENGINLVNTKTNRTIFLKENKRILIKTADGKNLKEDLK